MRTPPQMDGEVKYTHTVTVRIIHVNEAYYYWSVLISLYGLYNLYNEELLRSVSMKHTDRYDP